MQRFKGHSSKVVADLAVEWLGGDRQRPFCAVVGFKESRGPHTPPTHLKSLYAERPVEVDAVKPEHLEGKPSEVKARWSHSSMLMVLVLIGCGPHGT